MKTLVPIVVTEGRVWRALSDLIQNTKGFVWELFNLSL